MVREQIEERGVHDERVLQAMRTVPRHRFLPAELESRAYDDGALPLGPGKSISQPYMVAQLTALVLAEGPTRRVLEVGTGTGYQAAVLAEIFAEVFSVEIDPELARTARDRLAHFHYRNVTVRSGDGWNGWPEAAPFDAIIVTACAPRVPPALKMQLAPSARMVLPLQTGADHQKLRVVERLDGSRFVQTDAEPVRFVPMVREGS